LISLAFGALFGLGLLHRAGRGPHSLLAAR